MDEEVRGFFLNVGDLDFQLPNNLFRVSYRIFSVGGGGGRGVGKDLAGGATLFDWNLTNTIINHNHRISLSSKYY